MLPSVLPWVLEDVAAGKKLSQLAKYGKIIELRI